MRRRSGQAAFRTTCPMRRCADCTRLARETSSCTLLSVFASCARLLDHYIAAHASFPFLLFSYASVSLLYSFHSFSPLSFLPFYLLILT